MTSATAKDRLARAELLYREAQIELVAAQQRLDACYSVYCEAKVLAESRFEVEPYDERSSAERYRDAEQARLERSDAP